jgi:putative tricarboxylic transport membrane protein
MYLAGIIGFLLRRSGYSVAGIVMGLILGTIGESAFAKSMQLLNYDPLALFSRPIAGLLLTAAAITLIWNIVSELRRRSQPAADALPDGETTTR